MKLEHQQHKLLQAHYEGAIPVELLRKEQQRITHSLTTVNHRIQTLEQDLFTRIGRLCMAELLLRALSVWYTARGTGGAPDRQPRGETEVQGECWGRNLT